MIKVLKSVTFVKKSNNMWTMTYSYCDIESDFKAGFQNIKITQKVFSEEEIL